MTAAESAAFSVQLLRITFFLSFSLDVCRIFTTIEINCLLRLQFSKVKWDRTFSSAGERIEDITDRQLSFSFGSLKLHSSRTSLGHGRDLGCFDCIHTLPFGTSYC